jgi:hypothetical protein
MLAQSDAARHALPTTQPEQVAPPQSTSVSPGLTTPSSQEVATHRDVVALQNVDAQSSVDAHALPTSHFGQLPPQSTSLSVPSFIPSLHIGSTAMSGS